MKNERLANLVKDDRSLKERLLLSILVGFACVYTFIIFGVFDLFVANKGILPFIIKDIALPTFLIGLICFSLLFGILILLKGKLFDMVVSLLTGFLLAGYIQGNFLNLNLGQLTGDAIPWDQYTTHAVINTLIWAVILIIPLVLRYFSRKIWKFIIILMPALLICMQLVALVSSYAATDAFQAKRPSRYLSYDGLFEVSTKENIIVIILDRLDGKYVDAVFKDDPDFFEELDGFTYYHNNTSLYCRTYPSVTYMLTGKLSFYDTPADEYFTEAWGSATFLKELRESNYTTKLYIPKGYSYSDIAQLDGQADNIADGEVSVKTTSAMKRMLLLSAYRYSPHVLKPSFWLSTDEFSALVEVQEDPAEYTTDNAEFYERLRNTGISTQDSKNNFTFVHLFGCHRLRPDRDVSKQAKDVFELAYEYLRQMKDLNVYDDATIIITGDHGKSEDFYNLDMYKTTGMFIKPAGSAGIPLAQSYAPVSHANLQATILDAAGIPSEAYGDSYLSVPEDSDVIRKFYYRVNDKSLQGYLEEFEIKGDARDFNNWHKVGERKMLYPHG